MYQSDLATAKTRSNHEFLGGCNDKTICSWNLGAHVQREHGYCWGITPSMGRQAGKPTAPTPGQ